MMDESHNDCQELKLKKMKKESNTLFFNHNLDNLIFTKRERKPLQRLEIKEEKKEKIYKN